MGKTSIILGVFALIISLLPLLNGWFLLISWMVWLFATLSLILGIVAIAKKQKNGIVGIVLSVCSVATPFVFAGQYLENSAESSLDAVEGIINFTN